MDDSCNFYFEIGIENLDAIEYLQPKLIKAAQILDSQ